MHKQLLTIALLLILTGCASAPPVQPTPAKPDIGGAEEAGLVTVADATREDGRFTEALQIYQQVLTQAPAMTRAQLGLGECLLALGKPSEAEQLFQKLKTNPDLRAAASQGEGLSLLALGQPETAAARLHEAADADPALWRTWNALGDLADLKHQPDEAAKYYAKALAIKPNSAVVMNNIGYSELLRGRPPQAIEAFHAALAFDPKSETIRNNLRLAIAADGNYADAIRATTRDQLPMVLNNVGYVAMQRGDFTAAERYFAQAMEASSSYASVTAKNLELLKAERPSP